MDERCQRSPKHCPSCGQQGACTDSRMVEGYVRRRYHCKDPACGAAWTTAEVFVHSEAKQQKNGVHKALAAQANERALETFNRITQAVRDAFR